MKLNHKHLFSALAILVATTSQSFAAGYSTDSTSTSGLGNAYAGSVTGVHDVSDMFFNPSVTAGLDKNQFIAAMTYIKLKGASKNPPNPNPTPNSKLLTRQTLDLSAFARN